MSVLRVTLWWVALYALWWLLVGGWSPWNAVWGAGVATLTTVAALATGASGWGRRALGSAWPRELGSAALQVVLDFGVLTRALGASVLRGRREAQGEFLVRPTDARGPGSAPRRSWMTLLATWSPNAYVIDVDRDSGRALVHDLRPWRRSEEPL